MTAPLDPFPIRAAIREAAARLSEAGKLGAQAEARDIVGRVVGLSREEMVVRGTDNVVVEDLREINEVLERRLAGEPLDNILGERAFYGRGFRVSSHVLSPREDTEILVRRALELMNSMDAPRVLDLGTGSGALAVTLNLEAGAEVVATDISEAALAVARGNAEKFGAEVALREGSWFAALPADTQPFDMIVSNPPYIDDAAMETLEREVRDFDPDISLRGGPDGLVAYRAILAEVRDWLKPGAPLLVEIGYDQGESVPELFRAAGLERVRVEIDLAQNDRVVIGFQPSEQ